MQAVAQLPIENKTAFPGINNIEFYMKKVIPVIAAQLSFLKFHYFNQFFKLIHFFKLVFHFFKYFFNLFSRDLFIS